MNGARTVVGEARRDTPEQAFERRPIARAQVGKQRRERHGPRREDRVCRARAGVGEHERDRAAVPTRLTTQEPLLDEPVDQPHGRRLGSPDDASEIADRTAGPGLQMDQRAGLGLTETGVGSNSGSQPVHSGQGGHAEKLVDTIGHAP